MRIKTFCRDMADYFSPDLDPQDRHLMPLVIFARGLLFPYFLFNYWAYHDDWNKPQ